MKILNFGFQIDADSVAVSANPIKDLEGHLFKNCPKKFCYFDIILNFLTCKNLYFEYNGIFIIDGYLQNLILTV